MSADPPVVRTVSVIGAECTGKTVLCEALARALGGAWTAEVLREFCARTGRAPRRGEQAALARTQVARETAAVAMARSNRQAWVVFDSSPLVTAAYSLFYFADPSALASAAVHQRGYHATLLCAPDLPWVADGIQRDGARVRAAFDRCLRAALRDHHVPFHDVQGIAATRVASAMQALDALAPTGARPDRGGIK
jgi:nicotinamide riboside kinase